MVDADLKRLERNAYARGYQTGAHRWPMHKPPSPPDPIVRELMGALRELRDAADAQCATFGPDDEISLAFDDPIERADKALSMVSTWLRERE